MAAQAGVALAPHIQLNHHNPFRYDEDDALPIELGTRETSSRLAQEIVELIENFKERLVEWQISGAPLPHPRLAWRQELATVFRQQPHDEGGGGSGDDEESDGEDTGEGGGEGAAAPPGPAGAPALLQWRLGKNGIRYCLRQLSYFIDVDFVIATTETVDSMHEQAIAAAAGAVEAKNAGRLLPVVRPWDFTMANMEWSDQALYTMSDTQREWCFRIVHQYYSLNVSTLRFARDVYRYETYRDVTGMALYNGNRNLFALDLREVISVFVTSVQKALKAAVYADTLASRGGGGGGGGGADAKGSGAMGGGGGSGAAAIQRSDRKLAFSGRALYEITSQLVKHSPDGRLYTSVDSVRTEWFARWESEGLVLYDRSKLHIPHLSLMPLLRSVHASIHMQLREFGDIFLIGGKSVMGGKLVKKYSDSFTAAVLTLAPQGLVTRYRPTALSKVKEHLLKTTQETALAHRVLKELVNSLINLRLKALRRNDFALAIGKQKASFRADKAAKAGEARAEQLRKLDNQIKASW